MQPEVKQDMDIEAIYSTVSKMADKPNWLDPEILEEAVQEVALAAARGKLESSSPEYLYVVLQNHVSKVLRKRENWRKVGIPFSEVNGEMRDPEESETANRIIKEETRNELVDLMLKAAAHSSVPSKVPKALLMRNIMGNNPDEMLQEIVRRSGNESSSEDQRQKALATIRQIRHRFLELCREYIASSPSSEDLSSLPSLRSLGWIDNERNEKELIQAILRASAPERLPSVPSVTNNSSEAVSGGEQGGPLHETILTRIDAIQAELNDLRRICTEQLPTV